MSTKITDVIIHTRETLNDEQFNEVAEEVRNDKGVISFGRNQSRPNFLMVAYNAKRTRSIDILKKVTGFGIDASLVGI